MRLESEDLIMIGDTFNNIDTEQEVTPGCVRECFHLPNHGSVGRCVVFRTESGSHNDRQERKLSGREQRTNIRQKIVPTRQGVPVL